MTDEFLSYYGKNILHESKLINGVKEFLDWCKNENISMAVCTNKTEHLAVDLLKKIGIYDYFEYVAGYNTFDYCKPDPRHLTTVIEIFLFLHQFKNSFTPLINLLSCKIFFP